jgi:hypothetical protein
MSKMSKRILGQLFREDFELSLGTMCENCSGGGKFATFSRKSWKERWFVLRDGVLTYYETIGAAPQGTIPVKDIVDIIADDSANSESVDFSIACTDKTHHLRCKTPADCQVCSSVVLLLERISCLDSCQVCCRLAVSRWLIEFRLYRRDGLCLFANSALI